MPLYLGGQRIARLYKGAAPLARAWRGAEKVFDADEDAAEGAPLDGLANVTGAWSLSRKLLSSFEGAFYTLDTGVASVADQTGNSRHLAQATGAAQPSLASTGPQNRAAARHDGADDLLQTVALSSLIAAGTGHIVFCGIVRAIASDNAIAPNDAMWGDSAGYVANFLRSTGPSVNAYNYDGTDDVVSITTGFALDAIFVHEWRHEGGNLHARVNGGSWSSAASGNTPVLSGLLRTGTWYTGIGIFTALDLFEIVTFNAVPDEEERDALVANMTAYYG